MNQKLPLSNKPEKENQVERSKERSKDRSKLKLLSFKFLEYLLLFFAGIYIVIIIVIMFPFIIIIDYFSDFKDYIIEDFQKSLDIIINQPTLSDEEMVEFGNACVKIVKSLEIKNGD